MEEARGKHRVIVYLKNKENVRNWLKNNKGRTMKDCSKDLKLSYLTTRQHIKRILLEAIK